MRQLPTVKDGLISALLYVTLLLLPPTHCIVCLGHTKYHPGMSGFHFWLFFQSSFDDVDLDMGSEAFSALPLVSDLLGDRISKDQGQKRKQSFSTFLQFGKQRWIWLTNEALETTRGLWGQESHFGMQLGSNEKWKLKSISFYLYSTSL